VSEVERFRSFNALLARGIGFVVFFTLFLVSVVTGSWASASFFGVVAGLFVALLLPETFEVTIDSSRQVTFRALVRKKCVYVEDIQQIKRHRDEVNIFARVIYLGGYSDLSGRAGQRLARRLSQLNPSIEAGFDPVSGRLI
jgi:hypothetical protein